MFKGLYGKWMFAWETALTTRDENRIERPLEWGFEWLADFGGEAAVAKVEAGESSALDAMIALNQRIAADPHAFFDYETPKDFRIEQHFPELYPTNVRPETLEQEREYKRQAEVESCARRRSCDLLCGADAASRERFSECTGGILQEHKDNTRKPRQAMIVMPQWNADAFSHNALCELFNRFGISCLRLSKPYHDTRRPTELERSDYAVSANVGRTISACRQAVVDIRSCMDWLESEGYEQFGVLGTSLGSCYAFIAAAMDPRLRVCAFNHASTWFGDVVWTGQSTRHIRAAFEGAGLTQNQVREMFLAISPMAFMDAFAESPKTSLVVYAPYDLTFRVEFSREVLKNFEARGVDFVAKVLPCGHYTTGETPYKYIDGWFLGSFVYGAFKRLATERSQISVLRNRPTPWSRAALGTRAKGRRAVAPSKICRSCR